MERNQINVMYVATYISQHSNLVIVAKPLWHVQVLLNTKEFIIEKNLTNVKNVTRPLTSQMSDNSYWRKALHV